MIKTSIIVYQMPYVYISTMAVPPLSVKDGHNALFLSIFFLVCVCMWLWVMYH